MFHTHHRRMIHPRACASLLVLLSLTTAVIAQPNKPDLSALDAVVQAELKRNNVPGCAVAIVLGSEVLFAKGYGIANVDTGEPVHADMLFRLGSTTKMFTAATLVALAEQGRVKLDAPIGAVSKDLHPRLARLTPQQLLSHTAGLADETIMEGPHDDSALATSLRGRKDDLCFAEPDEIWSYSNPGYWLAGLVIEDASGKLYADAVREHILAPLGMKRSTFRPTEAMTWPLAVGHGPKGAGEPSVIRPLADNAAAWPAGQLFASVNEFALFCIAFVNGGKIDGHQALPPSLIETLSTPRAAVPGGRRHYGYGLSIEDVDGLRWLSHGGSRTGYGSLMRMCPEKKFAVIILCNKSGASLPRVAERAIELTLGVAAAERDPRNDPLPATADELARYAGVYSNGKTNVQLVMRDGKLCAAQGDELMKVGEHRFVRGSASEADSSLLFVTDDTGEVTFLLRGTRALKKISETAAK
jgi:CubicO group peptidase (beta-lactamase class C family)